jgi:hypothetical protein
MKFNGILLLSGFVLCALCNLRGLDSFQSVSLCALHQDPQRFLNTDVEVSALILIGGHNGSLKEGECLFNFAFGDDYQTFGDRFTVKHDAQWNLMKKVLSKPVCSSINNRVVKGRIKGTVVRTPATGTIPEDEMPAELVIREVAEIERVPLKCPNPEH